MRLRFGPLVCIILWVISCSGSEQPVSELTIIYSGNIGGKIEPCGCEPPLGGMPRRAILIQALRDQYTDPLILDSGALMYERNFLSWPLDVINRLEGGVAAKAMDMIGADAINVSSFDLANSIDSLRVVVDSMSIPWLSANLVWRDTGKPIFTPNLSVVRNGVRIGIFGIMSNTFKGSPLYTGNESFRVEDPLDTASRQVEYLRESNDLIIALIYASRKEMEAITEQVPGIHLIIYSHNDFHTPSSDHGLFQPSLVNNTVVARCPDGGRVIGTLELTIVGNKMNFTERPDLRVAVASAEERQKLIASFGSTYLNSLIDLGPEIRSDAAIESLIVSVKPAIEAQKDIIFFYR
ncbi:hypothetical protein ACFL5H_00930 [Candidatus Latescibacterota bacterium]